MLISNTPSSASLLVVCLCVEWCGVCREYRIRFEQVKALVQAADPAVRALIQRIRTENNLSAGAVSFKPLQLAQLTRASALGGILVTVSRCKQVGRKMRVAVDIVKRKGAQLFSLFKRRQGRPLPRGAGTRSGSGPQGQHQPMTCNGQFTQGLAHVGRLRRSEVEGMQCGACHGVSF